MTTPNEIHSMTGFGAGTAQGAGCSVRVEIRSVNHRGTKLNVRSRPSLVQFEKNLRGIISNVMPRGAIDVFVTLERSVDAAHVPVRAELARVAISALRTLSKELNLQDNLSASDLAQIPGLFEQGWDEPIHENEWPVIEEALNGALTQAVQMRKDEGEATRNNLRTLLEPLAFFRKTAMDAAPEVIERLRTKLRERLTEALGGQTLTAGDEQALLREVCLFADRADIQEEMARLSSHLEQFAQLLDTGDPECGKRIEFLAQECLREVNTTASKANDVTINAAAVDAKLAVEKIKEQAANLQ